MLWNGTAPHTTTTLARGRRRETPPGIGHFVDRWLDAKPFLVGDGGIPLKEFLLILLRRSHLDLLRLE